MILAGSIRSIYPQRICQPLGAASSLPQGPQPGNGSPITAHRQPRAFLEAGFKGGLSVPGGRITWTLEQVELGLDSASVVWLQAYNLTSLSFSEFICKMEMTPPHNAFFGIKEDGVHPPVRTPCLPLLTWTPETLSQTILIASDTTRPGAHLSVIFISFTRPAVTSRTQRKLSPKLSTPSLSSVVSYFAEQAFYFFICCLLPQLDCNLSQSRDFHLFLMFHFGILAQCRFGPRTCSKNRNQLIFYLLSSPKTCPRVLSWTQPT